MRTMEMVAGLVVSVAAAAALVMGFVWDVDARFERPAARIAPEPAAPAPPLEPASGPPPAAVAVVEAAADEPAPEAEEPAGVVVPDLTGRTALRALRQAREAGLEVDIRDREGNRVIPSERLYVRVIDQGNPEGSRVPEGTTISLTARYPRGGGGFASGY